MSETIAHTSILHCGVFDIGLKNLDGTYSKKAEYNSCMSTSNLLHLIKLIHTIIWVIMVAGILYIVYCGLTDNINNTLYGAIGLLAFEMLTLLINRWSCPLTVVAQKYQSGWQPGDDIYLPKWLAIHNKTIFGSLLMFGLGLVVWRILT